jgi:FG-GAP repeat
VNSMLQRFVLACVTTASLLTGVAVSPAEAANGFSDITWFNPSTGVVGSWLLNGSGRVLGTQDLSWKCTASSGCSSQWHPVGIGDMNGDGHQDVVWFNPSTGVVGTWLLNGSGRVLGTQDLSWKCTASSGCSSQWHPVGIANGGLR